MDNNGAIDIDQLNIYDTHVNYAGEVINIDYYLKEDKRVAGNKIVKRSDKKYDYDEETDILYLAGKKIGFRYGRFGRFFK